MAAYKYDDFRVTFTMRPDGAFDVLAIDSNLTGTAGVFRIPLSDDELRRTVVGVGRTRTGTAPPVGDGTGDGTVTRDVGGQVPPTLAAESLGEALAGALLSGAVGEAYDDAREEAERSGRGLRLSLSLASAPALLSVPWEFLYRRPRFLASQRRTPLVRVLDTGSLDPPPIIESDVRILGVVASPSNLPPLDVNAERTRVEHSLARVRELGRVQLDWLEPATPRRLREALRDGSYHIVHYVGHGEFSVDGEGVLFLEDDTGDAVEVGSTAMANLLSDQHLLRLVVLNSCKGARNSLTDPFAGVATTLIQLGVPAVVAMQFEISDAAAIVFAAELYTNLIARQDPIDAAIAEARKAIYFEVDKLEWATPVLYVRDPDVKLFDFAVPVAPLPPPSAYDDDAPIEASPADTRLERVPRRRTRSWLGFAAVGLAAASLAGGLILWASNDHPERTDRPPDARAPISSIEQSVVAETDTDTVTNGVGQITAEPIGFSQTVTGAIETKLASDSFTFEGVAGQEIAIEVRSIDHDCFMDLHLEVKAPDDISVVDRFWVGNGGCHAHGPFQLRQDGTYTVVLSGGDGGIIPHTTGSYTFRIVTVPEITAEPVGFSQVVTGTIETSLASDSFTFEGAAGQEIAIEMRSIDHDCFMDLHLEVKAPDDISVVDRFRVGDRGCHAHGPFQLRQDGTYTVVLSGGDGGIIPHTTGSYTFRIVTVPENATARRRVPNDP